MLSHKGYCDIVILRKSDNHSLSDLPSLPSSESSFNAGVLITESLNSDRWVGVSGGSATGPTTNLPINVFVSYVQLNALENNCPT